MAYVVKLSEDSYLGRRGLDATLGPQAFAFAYCFATETEAAGAANGQGEVVPLADALAANPSAHDHKGEARRERLEERADAAESRSAAAYSQAKRIGDGIPMGQPVLLGHHSEKHHRRDLARIDSSMRKSVDAAKEAAELRGRAQGVGHGGISSDDSNAIVKLRAQLADLEAQHEQDKAINKAVRSKDPGRALLDLDLNPKTIEALLTPDFAGRIGVPSYVLSNRNGNMARIRARILELEKASGEVTTKQPVLDGLLVVDNVEENRLQLFFDAKPSERVRDVLKGHGFRWSPTTGAWQRHRKGTGLQYAVSAVVATMKQEAAHV